MPEIHRGERLEVFQILMCLRIPGDRSWDDWDTIPAFMKLTVLEELGAKLKDKDLLKEQKKKWVSEITEACMKH